MVTACLREREWVGEGGLCRPGRQAGRDGGVSLGEAQQSRVESQPE